MPLRSGLTPAVLVAPWLDRALALGGVIACLLGAAVLANRGRRGSTLQPDGMGPAEVGQDVQPADVDPEAART